MTIAIRYSLATGKRVWSATVTVADQEQYGVGPLDFGSHEAGSLDRVIGALAKARDSIPEPYRASATCEIEAHAGYEDSMYPNIKITYTRPATTEEIDKSEADLLARAAAAERKERQTFEALKAKFEK